MQARPVDEKSSPLSREQANQLTQLVESLSPEQATWISGFLAGLAAAQPGGDAAAAPATGKAAAEVPRLTILYGSETGNAQEVAEQACRRATERGLTARVVDMADYKTRELKNEQLIMVVTATHGEGDPPDPAHGFYEFLHSRKAPKLSGVRFAVLGLGDSSYEHFCQTGKDFDARFEALGAERLHQRVDCDVDYEEIAERWVDEALGRFEHYAQPGSDNVVAFSGAPKHGATEQASPYGKKNPFPAEVLDNIVLTGRGSDKETRHIELSLDGSGLTFEPGDALCVVAENRPEVVAELLEATGLDGTSIIDAPSGQAPLEQALRQDYEITTVTPPFLKAYAERAGSTELKELVESLDVKRLTEYRWGRHVIDVIREYPISDLEPQEFVKMLRRLQPREYSIASSYNANPDEVHLTVAAVRYHSYGRDRHGVASTYLADFVEPGNTVSVYVQRNKNFKLPDDPSRPIIMVGPGTGVAPFRAFMEEREYQSADGKNWLFFGERRFRTDFLYQVEWQRWLKDGVLDRMDVAFSRDSDDKVYVQHCMLKRSREIYQWLEDGAYLYVCGDAEYMAPDVHRTLEQIVQQEGNMSPERATEYVKNLQQEKRYQRDVY